MDYNVVICNVVCKCSYTKKKCNTEIFVSAMCVDFFLLLLKESDAARRGSGTGLSGPRPIQLSSLKK